MHVVRADLHLERLAVGPDHRGVQRLVHAEPRLRDVVLEPPRHRLPQRVHHADGGVAVAHLVDEHAHADQVVDVVEVPPLDDHLAVDRVVVLGPALDGDVGEPRRVELLAHLVDDLLEVGVAGRGAGGHQPHDLGVLLRVQDREGQVLQLPLDGRHPEPVRERRHHLQRLAGLLRLLLRRQEAHRAHVVQPVGQLDDQHPGVAGHRDDHLADGLRLGRVAELDLVQLGDAVDEVRHLVAELLAQPVQRVVGVLHRVVQQRRHQRGGVHAQLGEDRRDGQRVRDVGIAGLALLARVLRVGHLVRVLSAAPGRPSGAGCGARSPAAPAPAARPRPAAGSCAGPGAREPGGWRTGGSRPGRGPAAPRAADRSCRGELHAPRIVALDDEHRVHR